MHALILFALLCGAPVPPALRLPETQEPPLTYAEAFHRAVREQKRLVVTVGFYSPDPHPIAGCVVCRIDRPFAGVNLGVIVGVPNGSADLARCDLPIDATDAQILTVIQPQPAAQPVYYRPVQYPVFFGGCANGRCGR